MKNNHIRYPRIILIAAVFCFSASLLAQQKEVRVVKPYSPTLSAAEKIELLPSLDEEIDYEMPEITYRLVPKLYESPFRPEPIQAARMVKPPLKRLYKSQLKLGMGNYLTPLAELNINQLRSRRGSFGLRLKHHSMNGELKLDNELKVPAGFNENVGEILGSRYLNNATLDYYAGASYHTYVQYGVDPSLDTIFDRKSETEDYFTAKAGLALYSSHADSSHINYQSSLDYYYFTHQFDRAEHGASLDFSFDKQLRLLDLAGEAGAYFYGRYPDWDSIVGTQLHFWLNPRVEKGTDQWRFTAGFNTHWEHSKEVLTPHFYPRASFQFSMVREVIVPYFGVDGYLETYGAYDVVKENPYVVPGLTIRPTDHKLIAYGGLKGRISKGLAYNFGARYSVIEDAYFFVNDPGLDLGNQFRVVYDDVTLARLRGELTVRPSDSWKFFLKGNYYAYLTMVSLDHPWNKPEWDMSLQARYNMQDKIILSAGLFAIGSRYYEDYNELEEEILPWVLDANLGLEYRYSKLLSFWAHLNNVAAQKYYLYHQYPAYRFRFMLGFTYAL